MSTYDATLLPIGIPPNGVTSTTTRNSKPAFNNYLSVFAGHFASCTREGKGDTFAAGNTKYYLMRARDANAGGVTYRSWVVFGSPDFTASRYTGTYSGGSINFTDVTVAQQWMK